MTTILDVCKLANVSKATVSRVLSGNRKVKDDTRDVVMRAVEQLNYRPNQLAQTLATKVSNTIGVLTNGLTDMQLGCRMGKVLQPGGGLEKDQRVK